MTMPTIAPLDAANARTIAQGHPPDWRPPQPKAVYDLVVIGAGPAGLSAALPALRAGRAVAVIERNLSDAMNITSTRWKMAIEVSLSLASGQLGRE